MATHKPTEDQQLLEQAKKARLAQLMAQVEMEFSKPEAILTKLKSEKVLENNKKMVDELIVKHDKIMEEGKAVFVQLQQAKKELTELAKANKIPIGRQYVYKTPKAEGKTSFTADDIKNHITQKGGKVSQGDLIDFLGTTVATLKKKVDGGILVTAGVTMVKEGTSKFYKLLGA